jgi:hypothetical protein
MRQSAKNWNVISGPKLNADLLHMYVKVSQKACVDSVH